MEYGVHLPHIGHEADRETLVEFAKLADSLGFHSGWVSDHIAWPTAIESRYPYTANGDFPAPFNTPWLDPLGTLLFVAACTERLRLGTTVLILGYRPPVQTAKLLATLDVLSGGRAILGVGVGWMREEFEALGMPFDHRGARGDEQLEIFEELFNEPQPSYEGRFYRFPALGFQPKPVRGHIPVWVGGDTEPAFRRAGRYGDAFHVAFEPLEAIQQHWSRVKAFAEEFGRDPESLTLSVRLYLDFDGMTDPAKSLQGSADQVLEQIGRYADAGVSHLLLDITARGGAKGRQAAMERFAAEIIGR
ncbi:MAG TPA: LLM class F420-dependent oxidoreductase [Tepidiformaceae bacterium]|nr:LLM class F420-dependent oxidoreductase [Tepidiformaceae bacterium]